MYNDILTKATSDNSYIDTIFAICCGNLDYIEFLGYNPLEQYGDKQIELHTVQGITLLIWERKIIVPFSARTTFLRDAHRVHLGFLANYDRIALRYWWPEMQQEFREFTNLCTLCAEFDKFDSLEI